MLLSYAGASNSHTSAARAIGGALFAVTLAMTRDGAASSRHVVIAAALIAVVAAPACAQEVFGESLCFSRRRQRDHHAAHPARAARDRGGHRLARRLRARLRHVDRNGDEGNDLVEARPGAAFAPHRHHALRLASETVWRSFRDGRRDLVTRARLEYAVRW
jgi:hypothetical protein